LDALIARGLADAGRTRPGSDVFDRLEARLAVQTDGKWSSPSPLRQSPCVP